MAACSAAIVCSEINRKNRGFGQAGKVTGEVSETRNQIAQFKSPGFVAEESAVSASNNTMLPFHDNVTVPGAEFQMKSVSGGLM